MAESKAVAVIHREQIIEQLSQGLRLSDIAPRLGLSSPNSISKALKADPEYRHAIEAGFHARLDKAEEAIEEAVDQVDVARARARFQSVGWRAEREFPERWAAKQQIEHSGAVTVAHLVRTDIGALIERAEHVVSAPQTLDVAALPLIEADSEQIDDT
jgi:hypothetical protein